MLRFSKLHQFTLTPGKLAWPWVAFTPARTSFVVPEGPTTLALRGVDSLGDVRQAELSEGLAVPSIAASSSGTTSRQPGLHSMALHPDGRTVVGFGWHDDGPAACIARVGEAPEFVDLRPALGQLGPMAATFTRDGEYLWLSAESSSQAALLRLRLPGLVLEARATFAPPPPPAAHELFLHPAEDAVLLTMACGQDGTFLQVARMVGEKLALVVTEGDGVVEPCGLAEATDDGGRVCLVAAERVELRRWPDLVREAELELPEQLLANYNGVRVGGRFLVSAADQDKEGHERAVVLSDTLGLVEIAPALSGMWAGRLGKDRLVTLAREKADRRLGFVYRVEG
jgi:hypothetical protein